MDQAFDQVLARYTARMAEETRRIADAPERIAAERDQLLLAVGEKVARVLHALIVASGATRILELGTSYGFSTLFLADAARATGGRVLSMDVAADKQAYARSELAQAGLDGFVDFAAGDAIELLREAEGPFDFVLLDIWKDLYVPCLEVLRPRLAPGALIAADNMLQPEAARPAAERYRTAVRESGEFQSVLLEIGSGVELSVKVRE
jgi:predicted O-methyltransferase YrrM